MSVRFRDAHHLHQFFHQNSGAKKFLSSNLYRGLFYRLHPVFGLLGSEYSATWEGRLLDYVYEKTMSGRPLTLAYFPQRNLNSPFGSAVAGLGDVEQKLFESLLSPFAGGTHTVPLSASQEQQVQSLNVHGQKFAKGLDKGCLGLSRDPYVAAYLTSSCSEMKADAVIDINMLQLLPAISGVYKRFFSSEGNLAVQMAWENSSSNFKPMQVEMPVISNHQFKKGAIPSGFFSALPASSVLVLAAQIPDPGGFTPEAVKTYLSEPPSQRQQREALTLGLVAFWLDEKLETAVLIGKEAKPEELEGFRELYNDSSLYEVHFARVCKQFVGVAASAAAVEELNRACAGTVPNLLHLSQSAVQKIHGQNSSAAMLVNFSEFLHGTYRMGLKSLDEGKESSPEVKEAQAILGDLPYYFFAGDVDNSSLVMKEVR